MSAALVRAALEGAIAAMSPPLATEWENLPYKNADGSPGAPVPGTPYQRVTVLLADPANPVIGSFYTEQGFLQVDLKYPPNKGHGEATARANLIRSTFPRGAPFTASGVTVTIERTPSILPGRTEPDRYVIPVQIRFYAHILGS